MATKKKEKKSKSLKNPRLFQMFIEHAEELWEKHERRFLRALDDSGKQTIVVGFRAQLDLSGVAPAVDTTINWKDKSREDGTEVIKSFKASLTTADEDPNAPYLPGADPKANGDDERIPQEQGAGV